MGDDIVSDMIKEMDLSPQKLQEISSQDPANAGQMHQNSMQGHQGMQYNPGMQQNPGNYEMQQTPEQQLQSMQMLNQQLQQEQQAQQMQSQQMQQMQQMQQRQPQYDESTESTGSVVDINKFGMKNNGSFIDQILHHLQNPLIVLIAFIILSLPPVINGLNNLLRAYVSPRGYLMIGIRAVLSSLLFYLTNFLLE